MKTKFLLTVLLSILLLPGGVLSQASIGFTIQNDTIINGKFEFDIYASASDLGTYHSRGQVYINYSNTFGDSVVSFSRATFQHLSLLNESIPFFGNKSTTIGFADNSPQRMSLTWQTNFPAAPPSTTAHTMVPANLTPLYHITLDIVNSNVPIEISFEQTLMNGQQFQIIAPQTEVPYSDWVFPVELLDFQASAEGNEVVRLDWLTSQEINNDYFVIEKKIEGQDGYHVLAEINGAGTTDEIQMYSFTDRSTMGESNYYRLKQVDYDGTTTYSKMIEVRMEFDQQAAFEVYPNPTQDIINLKIKGNLEYDRTYEVVNAQGTILISGELTAASSFQVAPISLGDLPSGMYFVRVQGELEAAPFIKI